MSNPRGGGVAPSPLLSTTRFVQTNIVDDDGDPSSVVLSVDKTSFGEADAAGTVNVTATLEGRRAWTGTFPSSSPWAAPPRREAPDDYTATTLGNITITSANEASGTASFTVFPVNDEVVEGDETILIDGAVQHLEVTPATITITDNDTATLGITADAALVSEGRQRRVHRHPVPRSGRPGGGCLVGRLHCRCAGLGRRLRPGRRHGYLPARLRRRRNQDHNHGHFRPEPRGGAGDLHRDPGQRHRRPVLQACPWTPPSPAPTCPSPPGRL